MHYDVGDLIWIPDSTMGIISESVRKEFVGQPAQFVCIDGPTYGVVIPPGKEHMGTDWVKAYFEKQGKQKACYIQKKDVRRHSEA